MRIWFNTSDLAQQSGLITRMASDLGRVRQKYPCTVQNIIGLQHPRFLTEITGLLNFALVPSLEDEGSNAGHNQWPITGPLPLVPLLKYY
jgi:hypothetical protein